MIIIFLIIGWFLIPILSIVFCLNLVSVLKKIKNNENTSRNTFWMTAAFLLIMWSIAGIASSNAY